MKNIVVFLEYFNYYFRRIIKMFTNTNNIKPYKIIASFTNLINFYVKTQ